jgi:hypothetical protein
MNKFVMRSPSPFMVALFHPLNLAMLALVAAAGLCAAWWLFPLGLLFWGVMLLLVMRDPALQMRKKIEARTQLARRFQVHFERIQRAQVSLFNMLSHARLPARRALQPTQAAVDRLVDQAYQLGMRMTALENHLLVEESKQSQAGKEQRPTNLIELEEKIALTSDPLVRQELEEALAQLQKRQERLRAIAGLLERVDAQLASLSNSLESAVTEAISLQALDPNQVHSQIKDLVTALEEQSIQLEQFSREAAIL